MKRFIVLYKSDQSVEAMMNVPPEQAQAGMDAWMAWAGKAGSAIVDMGAPLGNKQTVTKTAARDSAALEITGYSIMQSESMDALKAMIADHPHFMSPGKSSIDIFECLPMPGMPG